MKPPTFHSILLLFLLAGIPATASAQAFKPGVGYRYNTQGNFDIFNGSANFTPDGNSGYTLDTGYLTQWDAKGGGREVTGAGRASELRYSNGESGLLSQVVSVSVHGFGGYGYSSFRGHSSVRNTGSIIGDPTQNHLTGKATVTGWMDIFFEDEITIESSTLPVGTEVSVAVSMTTLLEIVRTNSIAVTALVPPPGGGAPTAQQISKTTTTRSSTTGASNSLGIIAYRANGSYAYSSGLSQSATGKNTRTLTVEVGGKLAFNYYTYPQANCGTGLDGISAEIQYSQHTNIYATPLTADVWLHSASGASYKAPSSSISQIFMYPPTPPSATSPGSMLLTCPDGGIFQVGTFTNGVWTWDDLPDQGMLVVPFAGGSGIYRVRTP